MVSRRSDAGVAMVVVIVWCTAMLLVAMIVAQAVIANIAPSDLNERSFRALSAAEAGVEDFRARVHLDPRYYARNDASNPALGGTWATVKVPSTVDAPSGSIAARFQYTVDSSQADEGGEIVITSRGCVGEISAQNECMGVQRTVQTVLKRMATYDYGYVSNVETIPPTLPGWYDGDTGAKRLDLAQARVLCDGYPNERPRLWRTAGPVLANASGVTTQSGAHRNSIVCAHRYIDDTYEWSGSFHTNDTWYVKPPTSKGVTLPNDPALVAAISRATLSTSCGPPESPNSGCPEGHRWIDQNALNDKIAASGWPSYLTDETPTSSPPANLQASWNPAYVADISFSRASSALETVAAKAGCTYTGPTRIRIVGLKMYVTSPDSPATLPSLCTNGTPLAATTKVISGTTVIDSAPTAVLDLATMRAAGFNGVIYIQSAASKNVPTCQTTYSTVSGGKTVTTHLSPIPITSAAALAVERNSNNLLAGFGPSSDVGFPPSDVDTTDAWIRQSTLNCNSGSLYVEGGYGYSSASTSQAGRLTIGAANDVAITGPLYDAMVTLQSSIGASERWTYGIPPATSPNLIGVVAGGLIYVYQPPSSSWAKNHTKDLLINGVYLSVNGCFAVQRSDGYNEQGALFMRGSLGQFYSCPVTAINRSGTSSTTAYTHFNLIFDNRLEAIGLPPYMMELSLEPWRVASTAEVRG